MKEYDLRDAEEWREYILNNGGTYTIIQPRTLFITDSGSHRVIDVYNMVHRIPKEEIGVIRWRPKDLHKPVKF